MWDERKFGDQFSEEEATAILEIQVPQHDVCDRVAWSRSNNGLYDVKTGYQLWFDQYVSTNEVSQSNGWSTIKEASYSVKDKDFYLAYL